ncbi:unnamed protein product [Victoria cruziana]
MIRASFFYGNYDGKSSPPSFDLQFDGNHWATITTSSAVSYYWEAIYAPKRGNISVCVAQTSADHIPFISFLQVKEFEAGMHETERTEDVLLLWQRRAFGAKRRISFQLFYQLQVPDDPYDRYWQANNPIDGVISVKRDNMSFVQNFTGILGVALAQAITPASTNATTLTIIPSSEICLADATYYYSFYFMEVNEAAYQNKCRSFDFLLDGVKLNDYGPIIPPYQSRQSHINHVGRRLTVGSVVSFVNTPGASLPQCHATF